MILEPYRRPPAPPRVAVLTEAGVIVDEDGQRLFEDEVEPGTRVFAQWDVVRQLMAAHMGEALCWNNEEVRWRMTAYPEEDEWRRRPSDAYVLRLPLSETLTPAVLLRALVEWRDWLGSYQAAPTGTTGSSAMSLLRARLGRTVVTGQGERPPLVQTRGGRLQLGPKGRGRYEGRLVLLDMPAAYATLIGEAVYGGIWQRLEPGSRLDYWLEQPEPLFLSAVVRVPRGEVFGPLHRCFQRRLSYMEAEVYRSSRYPDGSSFLYPTGRSLAGVWTREEILVALEVGCQVRIRCGWVQRAPDRPFAEWWRSVQDGRAASSGVTELLVKMTGNALWGRFALDPRVAGRRTIRTAGVSRELRMNTAAWPAHDLAEYVSGTTRARLYRLIRWAGDRLVSANTDGAWVRDVDESSVPEGWRVKARAHRLDLLEPACLRYWPPGSRWPRHVVSGVPFGEQAQVFEQRWKEA